MRRSCLVALFGALVLLLAAQQSAAAMPTLSAGATHTCAIGDTGGVWCWGDNEFGELGDGTTNDSSTPVAVKGLPSEPSAIVAADRSTCAIVTDKSVWCWGLNTSGQLGNGNIDGFSTEHPTPAQIPILTGVVRLSGAGDHYCAMLSDQTIGCWGGNTDAVLGTPDAGPVATPAIVGGLSNVRNMSVGPRHACAVLNDGTMRCWGDNTAGILGDGTEDPSSAPVTVQDVSQAAASYAADGVTCVNVGFGDMRCWGEAGKLGNPAGTGSLTAIAVPDVFAAAQIGGSSGGVCPIAGGQALVCWGENPGNGSAGPALGYLGLDLGVLAVSSGTGSGTTCYVVRGGTVKCWGPDNSEGQLGYSGAASLAPVPVAGLDLVTGRYTSTQVLFARNGKVAVDKKKRYFTVKAKLTAQIPSLIGLIDGCTSKVAASTSYSYKKVKRVKGKRKKVTVKKPVSTKAALFGQNEACVANVTFKHLPVKYLNHKSLSMKATWPGNASIQPFSKTASRFTLPKVKFKTAKKK